MPREFILPDTEARYAPDRPFDLQHYKLELDPGVENRSFSGTCTIRFAPIAPDQRFIELDAVELDIQQVRIGDEALSYSHDGEILRVQFAQALASGTLLELAIDYAAVPRRGLYFVGPDEHYPNKPNQVWTQGQDEDSRYWFPCLDSASALWQEHRR
ncbi:MAG: M1 family metallopeptidase [Myxococcales bacterium]|nr:M1 family metallopeptidase [Myxococcales bacterium]